MKQNYLTVTVFSAPLLNSNGRGESDGNAVALQKISCGEEQRTVLTGLSLRRALRDGIAAEMGEDSVFRHSNDGGSLTGYTYGPERDPSVKDALMHMAKEGIDPESFLDFVFGMMVVEKGVVNNNMAKGQYKQRSSLFLSDGISLSPFGGETTFHQGVNPEVKVDPKTKEKRPGDIAPFSVQRHFSRYQYRMTFDLNNVPEEVLGMLLQILVNGLRVGGSHARAESEVVPDALLWTTYHTPGGSRIYMPQFKADPVKTLDLSPFYAMADNRGVTLHSAGMFEGTTEGHPTKLPIKDAVSAIMAQVKTIKE